MSEDDGGPKLTPQQEALLKQVMTDGKPPPKVPRKARMAGDRRPTAKKVKDLMRGSMSRQPLDGNLKKSLSAKEYTKEMAMRELEEAALFAKDSGNPSAYVKAIEAKAKIAGLIDKNPLALGMGFQIQIAGIEAPKSPGQIVEIKGIDSKDKKE